MKGAAQPRTSCCTAAQRDRGRNSKDHRGTNAVPEQEAAEVAALPQLREAKTVTVAKELKEAEAATVAAEAAEAAEAAREAENRAGW